jgi:hypothetical protein
LNALASKQSSEKKGTQQSAKSNTKLAGSSWDTDGNGTLRRKNKGSPRTTRTGFGVKNTMMEKDVMS